MENVAIKGRGGNDVQHKNWEGKILRIWITIIRHGGFLYNVTVPSAVSTGNPGSVIVPQYGSSKITVFVWGKNIILKFLGNTK